jgi:hypothetical protein
MSALGSPRARKFLIALIVIFVLVASVAYYSKIDLFRNSTSTISSESSQINSITTSTTSAGSESSNTSKTNQSSSYSSSIESTSSSFVTTFSERFSYPIAINYSGSWKIVYFGQNGTVTENNATQNNVMGNLNGSGDYQTVIVLLEVNNPGERTLCVNATKLDSSLNNLTLAVLYQIRSTTAPYGSVKACGIIGP